MNKAVTKTLWWLFCISCIMVGLYPIIYFVVDETFGLMLSKSESLLKDQLWNFAFYCHIVLGGISLLIGWTQFSKRLRKERMNLHRLIGKVYVISVLISGVCGVYVAQFATGGLINVLAFSMSGLFWLVTTILAYRAIRKGNVVAHQNFMIYSYAVCFSAVTLRIWLGILVPSLGSFSEAYVIVGWLSWLPNVFVAYLIVNRNKNKLSLASH